jgi:hypothetical protein
VLVSLLLLFEVEASVVDEVLEPLVDVSRTHVLEIEEVHFDALLEFGAN